MNVISLNVGRTRPVAWRGKIVQTGIFKQPVAGPVQLRGHQLAGDGQADRSCHGGEFKAVYGYPGEHYPFWRDQCPDVELGWGALGENLTTAGLTEDALCIGDVLEIGTARLQVTQPRQPCYKLGIRLQDPRMVKTFLHSGRSGYYFAVVREGELAAGESIRIVARDSENLSVRDVALAFAAREPDLAVARSAAAHPVLEASWREHFQRLLDDPATG